MFIRTEIGRIRQASYLKAINLAIYFTSSKVILFSCFVTYVLIKGQLNPESIFVAMAYFNTLRITVTKSFPNSIAAYAEVFVSCRRIETFLLYEEIVKTNNGEISNGKKDNNDNNNNVLEMKTNGTSNSDKDEGVFIENATARWNKVSKEGLI